MGKIERLRESNLEKAPKSNDVVYPVTVTDATYTKSREKLSKYVIKDIKAEKENNNTKVTFTSEDDSKKEINIEGTNVDYLTYWEINHIIADVFGF